MSEPPNRTVETGYDRMAEQYLASKDQEDPILIEALEALSKKLPQVANVLDLGCGAGVPATRLLAERFVVTGVDVSSRQLELAREIVPAATFIKVDMIGLDFLPGSFDAVVAFYSIIHVPRERHPELVGNIHRWLKPGGIFLATWANEEWEGEEADWNGWGAGMWWSHHDGSTNLGMLGDAGFTVGSAESRTNSDGEEWLWVMARKPPEKGEQET